MPRDRLLCVPNSGFARRGSERLVSRHTAEFARDLARSWPGTVFAHASVDARHADELADYDLARHADVAVRTVPWLPHSRVTRALSNAIASPWIVLQVLRARALYAFLPGNLPLVAVLAARLFRRPYGVYLRGEMAPRWQAPTLGRAAFVLASNQGMLEVAARHCDDVELIRPMLEVEEGDVAEPGPQRVEGPWRILFVGRIEPRKGVPELVEAVEILRRRGEGVHLDLVGGGPGGDWLERFRERVTAGPAVADVRFHGVVSDRETLARFYREADLFVLPTHTDGFARVLFEAMVYGTPILTTFVGGIGTVMQDGRDCVRIEPRDPEGLAERIAATLADPDLRLRIARGGTRRVRGVLSGQREAHGERAAAKLRELLAGS